MAKLNRKEILQSLTNDNEDLSARTKELGLLDEDVLRKKKDAKTWSILECFDHMNKATELYLDQIEPKIKEAKPAKTDFYSTGTFAPYFTKGLAPAEDGRIKNKMKTTKVFKPEVDNLGISVIDEFFKNQERIQKVIDQLADKDLNSFKVTTALGKILRFYVGDALLFIIAHNKRHVLQAERLVEPSFV